MTIEEIKNTSDYLYQLIQKRISEGKNPTGAGDESAENSVRKAFEWHNTPEGDDFWRLVAHTTSRELVKVMGEVLRIMNISHIDDTNTQQDTKRKDDLVKVIDFLMSQRGNNSVLKIADHIKIINDDKNSIYVHLYIGSIIRNDVLEFLCENLRGMKWRIHLGGDVVHLSIDMPK